MTKVLVCSDLHTNFHKDFGKSCINDLYNSNKSVDIIVVAGDLSSGSFVLEQNIKQICSFFKHFVFVSGNHSYYGSDFVTIDNLFKTLSRRYKNFHWLNDKRINIDNVNFIGGTLWFPAHQNTTKYKSLINDYSCISKFEPEVYIRNTNTVRFLNDNIQSGDIVVTHHMPSYQCINPKYSNSIINCYFANNLDNLILESKPLIWIHGHGHDIQKCIIGDTKVIGNPFGYLSENPMFDENYILEI